MGSEQISSNQDHRFTTYPWKLNDSTFEKSSQPCLILHWLNKYTVKSPLTAWICSSFLFIICSVDISLSSTFVNKTLTKNLSVASTYCLRELTAKQLQTKDQVIRKELLLQTSLWDFFIYFECKQSKNSKGKSLRECNLPSNYL